MQIVGKVLPVVAQTTARMTLQEIILGGRQERMTHELLGQCLALQSQAITNTLGPQVALQVQRGILSPQFIRGVAEQLALMFGKKVVDMVMKFMLAFYEAHKMKITAFVILLMSMLIRAIDRQLFGMPSTGAKMALKLTKISAVTTLKMLKLGATYTAPALVNCIMTLCIMGSTMPKQLKESVEIINAYVNEGKTNTQMLNPTNMTKFVQANVVRPVNNGASMRPTSAPVGMTNAERAAARRARFGTPMTNSQKMAARLARFGPAN
jgi:hypothetical protein